MNDVPGSDQKVQVGCGSLILIALIVIVFGSGAVSDDIEDLEREVRSLQEEVALLREAVEVHTESHAREQETAAGELPLEATD